LTKLKLATTTHKFQETPKHFNFANDLNFHLQNIEQHPHVSFAQTKTLAKRILQVCGFKVTIVIACTTTTSQNIFL